MKFNLTPQLNSQGFVMGCAIILLAAVCALTMLLQQEFTSRIVQLEGAAMTNNQRLLNIQNVLVQINDQLQAQKSPVKKETVQMTPGSGPAALFGGN